MITCCTRSGSPTTRPGTPGPMRRCSGSPFSSAATPSVSWRVTRSALRSKGMASSVSRPASIFETSRMSLISPSRVAPAWWISPTYSRSRSGSGSSTPSRLSPTTALSGVRISWDMLARNWLFRWLAASAASRASRTASSIWLRSVMSRTMVITVSAVERTTRPSKCRSRPPTGSVQWTCCVTPESRAAPKAARNWSATAPGSTSSSFRCRKPWGAAKSCGLSEALTDRNSPSRRLVKTRSGMALMSARFCAWRLSMPSPIECATRMTTVAVTTATIANARDRASAS